MDCYCAGCGTPHDIDGLTQLVALYNPHWRDRLAKLGWCFAAGNLACVESCPKCDPTALDDGEAAERRERVRKIANACTDPVSAALLIQRLRLLAMV